MLRQRRTSSRHINQEALRKPHTTHMGQRGKNGIISCLDDDEVNTQTRSTPKQLSLYIHTDDVGSEIVVIIMANRFCPGKAIDVRSGSTAMRIDEVPLLHPTKRAAHAECCMRTYVCAFVAARLLTCIMQVKCHPVRASVCALNL